jgi:hypothetical protein
MLNHLTAHSWCARASSPLQLHSILSVSPPSLSSTKQILQTASSSGISSSSSGAVRPQNYTSMSTNCFVTQDLLFKKYQSNGSKEAYTIDRLLNAIT